ncbi:hypothetical protein IQ07DRAFT_253374 [Pyrenochaeta sp. DS3sAY3a]|nr:hypothetical protein IQ07DRAFT_253374 [Pyrenochaeta sp. DS3sAY3a]
MRCRDTRLSSCHCFPGPRPTVMQLFFHGCCYLRACNLPGSKQASKSRRNIHALHSFVRCARQPHRSPPTLVWFALVWSSSRRTPQLHILDF